MPVLNRIGHGLPMMSFGLEVMPALLNAQPGIWPAEPIDPEKPFKWQTRRSMVPQPIGLMLGGQPLELGSSKLTQLQIWDLIEKCSEYGTAGDLMKVREPWAHVVTKSHAGCPKVINPEYPDLSLIRQADWNGSGKQPQWREPRSMPEWASRIRLEIIDVRLERVQDITEEDAVAEGFIAKGSWTGRDQFHYLWDAIYGEDAWRKNEYLLVYDVMRKEV